MKKVKLTPDEMILKDRQLRKDGYICKWHGKGCWGYIKDNVKKYMRYYHPRLKSYSLYDA